MSVMDREQLREELARLREARVRHRRRLSLQAAPLGVPAEARPRLPARRCRQGDCEVDTRARIASTDMSLRRVRLEAEVLKELAEEWGEISEDEQIDFAMQWRDATDHLRALEELHAAGEMTEAQEREYAKIKRRIAELLPTIERLDLSSPGVPLSG